MKRQLVIKEAFGENISWALQETVRCSCLSSVCLPGSREANSLVFLWFLGCFIAPYKAGAQRCPVCPACARPAAPARPGWTREQWEVMPFRQTHVRNPLCVCRVLLDDGISCHFAKRYFEALEGVITSKDAKCKRSWVGLRFRLPMAWKWEHEN